MSSERQRRAPALQTHHRPQNMVALRTIRGQHLRVVNRIQRKRPKKHLVLERMRDLWNCTAYPYYRPFCNVVVYSQPANTGTGQHLMSQLYTVIQFLKVYPYNLDVLFESKLLARTFGISVRTYYVGTWYSTINHQHSFPHRRRYCQQRWALGQTCT